MKKKIIVELDEEVLSHIYQHGFFEEKDRHKVGVSILEGKELTDFVGEIKAEIEATPYDIKYFDEPYLRKTRVLEIIDKAVKETEK